MVFVGGDDDDGGESMKMIEVGEMVHYSNNLNATVNVKVKVTAVPHDEKERVKGQVKLVHVHMDSSSDDYDDVVKQQHNVGMELVKARLEFEYIVENVGREHEAC